MLTNWLKVCLFGIILSTTNVGQQAVPYVDSETYSKALDIVFPLKFEEAVDYAFLIRVKPAFDAEFLMRVNVESGKVEITRFDSIHGNLNEYFNKLLLGHKIETSEGLAKMVSIRQESRSVGEGDFSILYRNYFRLFTLALNQAKDESKRLSKAEKNELPTTLIHGTQYDIVYLSPSRQRISHWVYDHRLSAKTFTSPLTPWVKEVYALYQSAKSH